MTEPCHCPEYNPECTRPGLPMAQVGIRFYELCSGKCPPQRPCRDGISEQIRHKWDLEAAARGGNPIELPAQPASPPIAQQVVTFATEYALWVKAGKPRRSLEMIEQIRDICRACDQFNATDGNCNACGCGMTSPRPALTVASALTFGIIEAITAPEMETVHCPLPKPKW